MHKKEISSEVEAILGRADWAEYERLRESRERWYRFTWWTSLVIYIITYGFGWLLIFTSWKSGYSPCFALAAIYGFFALAVWAFEAGGPINQIFDYLFGAQIRFYGSAGLTVASEKQRIL